MPRSHAPVRSALLALTLAGSSLGLAGVAPAFAETTGTTPATTTGTTPATTTTTGTTTTTTTGTTGTTGTSSPPTVRVAGDTVVTSAAAPPGSAVQRAAAYVATQLADGDHVVGPYGTDLGQTADVVLGLTAARNQLSARDATARYLEAHLDDYVHGAAYVDGTAAGEKAGANYAGPTGKAVLVALAVGQDPTASGGFDLVAELTSLMATSGPNAGRFQDDSAYGDYSNPLGQAFDILALERATTAGAPAQSVAYLLNAQCADGGFADAWPASTKACTSSADSTGLALQALVAAGSDCAATRALTWLTTHAAKDGSFSSAATAPGMPATANVNSTAYAALGLTAAKRSTTAQVTYLSKSQNSDGGLPIVPSAKAHPSNLLATLQAVVALNQASYLSIGSHPTAARTPTCTTTPTTKPATVPATRPATAVSIAGTSVEGTASTLPRTGGVPFEPLLGGLVLIGAGTGALLLSRRPRTAGARHR